MPDLGELRKVDGIPAFVVLIHGEVDERSRLSLSITAGPGGNFGTADDSGVLKLGSR